MTRTLRVVLVRHGETDWNVARRLQGQVDIELSPVGRQQVSRLQPVIDHLSPDYVATSGLRRAMDTADVLRLPVDARYTQLNECHLGDWEGLASAELKQAGPEYTLWRTGRFDPPGAESHTAFRERIAAGFWTVVNDARSHGAHTVCIVTHGGVVRGLLSMLVGLDPAASVPSHPASVTILDVTGDDAKLRLYNYAGDLPLGDPSD